MRSRLAFKKYVASTLTAIYIPRNRHSLWLFLLFFSPVFVVRQCASHSNNWNNLWYFFIESSIHVVIWDFFLHLLGVITMASHHSIHQWNMLDLTIVDAMRNVDDVKYFMEFRKFYDIVNWMNLSFSFYLSLFYAIRPYLWQFRTLMTSFCFSDSQFRWVAHS